MLALRDVILVTVVMLRLKKVHLGHIHMLALVTHLVIGAMSRMFFGFVVGCSVGTDKRQ
jgi:hypothetical protein